MILRIENMEEFIKALETEFDELEPGSLKPDTNFRDLDEWSSMHALIIIALIETEYDVTITGEDLSGIKSVEQLHNLVVTRQA